MRSLVAGAGGFIGGHLVKALLDRGDDVVAVDIKPGSEWWQSSEAENLTLDLRSPKACREAAKGIDQVYNLATDMGGIGYLASHQVEPMRSVAINTNLIEASYRAGVERYLFTSSACIYGEGTDTAEANAWPLTPDDDAEGYAIEKAFSEKLCGWYHGERAMRTRVARLHNVYGPHGSWNDGREKAPAAICRKVVEAIRMKWKTIEVWGDGKQTRSFLHISDCIEGIGRIMEGESSEPVNLGSEEMVTVDELVSKVEAIAHVSLKRKYLPEKPKGVRGRTSDNTLMRERYGWEPEVPLGLGLHDTYHWIAEQGRG